MSGQSALTSLLQVPHSSPQTSLWLLWMSFHSLNQESGDQASTQNLAPTPQPQPPGSLAPWPCCQRFLSTSMGLALCQALPWVTSFNPNPSETCDCNPHFTEEEPWGWSVSFLPPDSPPAPPRSTTSAPLWPAEEGGLKKGKISRCLAPMSSGVALLWPEQ